MSEVITKTDAVERVTLPDHHNPDFVLPTELLGEIGQIALDGKRSVAQENGTTAREVKRIKICAKVVGSQNGPYSSVWFDRDENGELTPESKKDKNSFLFLLSTHSNSDEQAAAWSYFTMDKADYENARNLLDEKFNDVGGLRGNCGFSPTFGEERTQTRCVYTLFADMFRDVLQDNGINYQETNKPQLT